MESHSQGDLLRSWKEIASYLGVDERTCARWEQAFGMPVHRAGEGASKSRVFAYRSELDLWFQETFKNSSLEPGQNEIRAPRPAIGIAVLAAIILVGTGVFFAIKGILPSLSARAQPADFRFEGTVLVVVDQHGRELFRHDPKIADLATELYREHFQTKTAVGTGQNLPYLIIRDIDRDGWKEVLFSTHTRSEFGEGDLFCFNHRGTTIWHYKVGHDMIYGNRAYSNDYRIRGIDCVDLDGDGTLETVVIGVQKPEWPCQFSILDCRGNRIGEYWNSGYISDYAFRDIHGNTRQEIVIGGVNNEYAAGFVAVFDSADVHGGSPQQEDEYTCKSLAPGSQKYYFLIPRTDVDKIKFVVESVGEVGFLSNGRLSVKSGQTSLYYEFSPDMQLLDLKDSHTITQMHKELKLQGLVKSTLNAEYYKALKRNVTYWNGKIFTKTPSMSNPW